jgi:hypothetical protein
MSLVLSGYVIGMPIVYIYALFSLRKNPHYLKSETYFEIGMYMIIGTLFWPLIAIPTSLVMLVTMIGKSIKGGVK